MRLFFLLHIPGRFPGAGVDRVHGFAITARLLMPARFGGEATAGQIVVSFFFRENRPPATDASARLSYSRSRKKGG